VDKASPSIHEWQSLAKHPVTQDLENGRFQYVDDELRRRIVAVFTSQCGLDFTLNYAANSGELIIIDEAR
jgi:hypothetical protein